VKVLYRDAFARSSRVVIAEADRKIRGFDARDVSDCFRDDHAAMEQHVSSEIQKQTWRFVCETRSVKQIIHREHFCREL